jgi:glycosyltransferase involved in cell wall biosynthesis
VVTPWGSDIYRRAKHSRIARLLTIFTLRRADLITTNSYAISQQVLSLGARPRTTNFIQFGVELDIFSPSTNDLDFTSLHQRLELPSNSRLVLSARGVNTVYNLDIILNAIPDVIQRFPEAIFLFIDYNTNPSYKQQLESQILGMNLSPHIRWLPQTNSRTEMAEIYRQSDVVVSVPTTDGTPISVLEALACEKPVVCTDLPSLREFITSGENGLLVPVRQPGPLADAIIQLLAHPEIALTLGKFGRQVVAQKANVETEMQRMESLYRQLTDLKLGKTGC